MPQLLTLPQLQGEARRGERVDEFGKPETDLRVDFNGKANEI